jgi:hypothetical protein
VYLNIIGFPSASSVSFFDCAAFFLGCNHALNNGQYNILVSRFAGVTCRD